MSCWNIGENMRAVRQRMIGSDSIQRVHHVSIPSRHLGHSVLLVLSMNLLMGGSSVATAQDSRALIQRFQTEYPDAVKTLVAVYSDAKISGRDYYEAISDEASVPEALLNRESTWEFLGDGTSVRSVITVESRGTQAKVATPENYFDVSKVDDADEYSVKELTALGQPQEYEEAILRVMLSVSASQAPFGANRWTVQKFLDAEGCRIVGASLVDSEEGGDPFVQIDWETPTSENDPATRGWFQFDPKASWALHAYEIVNTGQRVRSGADGPITTGEVRMHGLISYDGMRDGVPLVSRVKRWTSTLDRRAPHDNITSRQQFRA